MGDLIGLILAVLASLASGVLIAYGMCIAFFRVLSGRRATVSSPSAALAIEA